MIFFLGDRDVIPHSILKVNEALEYIHKHDVQFSDNKVRFAIGFFHTEEAIGRDVYKKVSVILTEIDGKPHLLVQDAVFSHEPYLKVHISGELKLINDIDKTACNFINANFQHHFNQEFGFLPIKNLERDYSQQLAIYNWLERNGFELVSV